jgi:predicted nucleic acid-binding protein
MKFWDSSALVPLLVRESWTDEVVKLLRQESELLVWWASATECASAISRLEREGSLKPDGAVEAFARLDQLETSWNEIEPGVVIREAARRFLRVHDLRPANALQLAAAFVAAENRPPSLEIVTLDDRLAAAATREGFRVIDRDAMK